MGVMNLNHAKQILVVDDEDWVVKLVCGYLEQAGYAVHRAFDGPGAVDVFERVRPALVVLDVMLPGFDGLEVTRRIRKTSDVPIIMLTARTDEVDRVTGLEVGADDYVVKPFSVRELVSRVKAVLRRAEGGWGKAPVMVAGELKVDMEQRLVWGDGDALELTPMEFDLLSMMMQYPGRVFTRLHLLESLRGNTYDSFERSIDTHIKRLRQKVEPDPKQPKYVLTVYGVGYKFAPGGAP
jgi:DNA-binding response OmpR family regulator